MAVDAEFEMCVCCCIDQPDTIPSSGCEGHFEARAGGGTETSSCVGRDVGVCAVYETVLLPLGAVVFDDEDYLVCGGVRPVAEVKNT